MFKKQGSRVVPPEPFLEEKGLKGRKMALMEAGLHRGQELYDWFINVNVMIISCKKEITAENVRAAIQMLCQRHPNLRTKVVTNKAPMDRYMAFFETGPEPELQVLDTTDWVSVFEAEYDKNFAEGAPLWRVKMLKPTPDSDSGRLRYPFVLTYNHGVVDGGSIMAGIQTDFHRYLEDAVCDKVKDVESLPFLPGRETMYPEMQVTFLDRLKYKVREFFKGPAPDDPMANELMIAIQPEEDSRERCTKIIPFDFTAEQTKTMIAKCKENGIKFNGYVTAAAAIATGNLIRKYTKNPDLKNELTFDVPFLFNLRRACKPPIDPKHVGVLVTIMPMAITVAATNDGTSRDEFWDMAKKCHATVHTLLDSETAPVEATKEFNYLLEDADGFLSALSESKTPHSIYYTTNRGSFQMKSQYPDDEGACHVEEVFGNSGENQMNFDVFGQNVQSVNGRLMWTLGYYGHKCKPEIAKEYTESIKEILLKMSE